jgi:hypothetical protein
MDHHQYRGEQQQQQDFALYEKGCLQVWGVEMMLSK